MTKRHNATHPGKLRARAVIGCKIQVDKLFCKKKVKMKDHDYPESMVHDPKNGDLLWATINHPIDEYLVGEWPRLLVVNDLKCVLVESDNADLIASYSCVALMCEGLNKCKMIEFEDEEIIAEGKRFLKSILEPLGLWKENKFGLWVVLGP